VERVQQLRRTEPGAALKILLRPGTYRLNQTLVLDAAATGGSGGTLSIEAEGGGKVVVSGGVPLLDWHRIPPGQEPAGTPAVTKGKLWVTDLAEVRAGPWNFRALYDGFSFLPRARSIEYLARGKHAGLLTRLEHRDLLEYPPGSIKPWKNLHDVEILSRPNHNWLVNYLGIAALDESAGTVRTSVPATYTPTGRFWVENTMDALDEPGEWVLNTQSGKLYLWPRGAQPGRNIVAPAVRTLIRIAGRENCAGGPDEPVAGIRLAGLTFAHTDRDVWTPADAGIQHDWAMWDKDDACVRFRVARDCEVVDCVFEAAAGQGVRGDLFAQNIRIHGNTFRNLGAGGVLLCGYGPGVKDVNRGNEIVDNEFHHLGTLWWHAPAVLLWQSGENRVAHNYLHDLPYNGIVLSGVRPRHFAISTPKVPSPTFPPGLREDLRLIRWNEVGSPRLPEEILPFAHTRANVIQDNEIHDAMQVLKDGNAIYLSSAGKDNVIRRNFIYNMGTSAAIRTDDDQSYCQITENVTFGVGIVIKDFNAAWNNIMVNGGLRITSDRPDSRIERNVYVSYVGQSQFYEVDVVNSYFGNTPNDTMLNNYNPNHKPVIPPKTDRNLYLTDNPEGAKAFIAGMEKTWGNDRQSKVAEPSFIDPDHGDFRFSAGSAAGPLGIESVDTTHVGRLGEPMVERLKRTGPIDLKQRSQSTDKG
jgi:hypothetical protein